MTYQVFQLLYQAVEDQEEKASIDEVTPGSTAKNITMYTALRFKEDSITFHASPDWRQRGPWYDFCFIAKDDNRIAWGRARPYRGP